MKIVTDEQDVITRIVRWASVAEAVRAVALDGSRANPRASLDSLSDYDIMLIVADNDWIADGEDWVGGFGVPLLRAQDRGLQDGIETLSCMVLYDEGAKIDYSVWPVALAERIGETGTLPPDLDLGYRVLLDKDGVTANWPLPTQTAYRPTKPSAQEYQALIEEVWWVATYVAKYLWREELLTAKVILDYELKYLLLRTLLDWRIASGRQWSVASGFFARGLQRYLDDATWARLAATYTGLGREENWAALFATVDLCRDVAHDVGRHLGYEYPQDLDETMTAYLCQIQRLTSDGTMTRTFEEQ
ncbi:MAG: aminoglycoside 6-adenylyltransferase [Thermomicrobiales bacterium]